MQINSKEHLETAFSQIKSASSCLHEALSNVEKDSNKQQIQRTLATVEKAVYAAANAISNYQD